MNLIAQLSVQTDLAVLRHWQKLAARVRTIDEFADQISAGMSVAAAGQTAE